MNLSKSELHVWQIKQLIEEFENLREEEQKKVIEILKKYVNRDSDIIKTYNSLVNEGLLIEDSIKLNPKKFANGIPKYDEEKLKDYITNEIPDLTKIKE